MLAAAGLAALGAELAAALFLITTIITHQHTITSITPITTQTQLERFQKL